MNFNSLGSKIGGGYFFTLLVLIAVISVTSAGLFDIKHHSETAFDLKVPISEQSQRLQVQLNHSLSALRGWVVFSRPELKQKFDLAWIEIEDANRQLTQLSSQQKGGTLNDDLKSLKIKLLKLKQFQIDIITVAHTLDNTPGLKILFNEVLPATRSINTFITEIIELESQMLVPKYGPIFKQMGDFRSSMTNAISSLREYFLSGNVEFKREYNDFLSINENSYKYLQQNQQALNKEQRVIFVKLERTRLKFISLVQEVLLLYGTKDWDVAKTILNENAMPLSSEIDNDIGVIVSDNRNLLSLSLSEIKSKYSELVLISMCMLFIGVLLCVVFAIYITRLVVVPINKVIELSDKISKGDFNTEIKLHGSKEIETLSSTLKKMTHVLKQVTIHANSVARGDYKQDYAVQSDADQLGNAINQMTINLRDASQKNNEQDWIKSGRAGISDHLRGDANVISICEKSLNYLVKYVDSQVATLYLMQDDKLKLVTSYAYNIRHSSESEFLLGEGLIGQVALERSAVIYNDVSEQHIMLNIDSGLGNSAAASILVFPLINKQSKNNNIVGVVALGAAKKFGALHLELIDKVAESIAIAIESANSHAQVQILLEESRTQSEELQKQQDELSATNEELEEQATSLMQTEEELRAQSESLKSTNKILEEKTKMLEEQQSDIKRKNSEVENSRLELEKKAFDLELANKYKSEFLANMSHELRTPLNSLLIISQIMGENHQGNLTEEQINDIKMIHSGGVDLLTLINDILDLSKVEAGKLDLHIDKVDIHKLVLELKGQFVNFAKTKEVELDFVIADGVPDYIYSDRQRLEQVLRNLLSNAIKFTHKGEVELAVDVADRDFKFFNPEFTKETVVKFSVKDTGIGIPASQQQLIFEAFQQGDGTISRKFGGTGLGLTISRELSRLLQAEIRLSSEENKGSTFTLYLGSEQTVILNALNNRVSFDNDELYVMSSLPGIPEDSCVFIPDDRNSATNLDNLLLIIDDNPNAVTSVMAFANTKGFKCIATDKGMDALELVMQYPPNAIILNLNLADMTGLTVLEALKSSPMTRNVPVHIMPAQDSAEFQKSGVMKILSKPTDLNALNEVLYKIAPLTCGSVKQILLIEDDEISSQSIKRFLEEKDINISIANSGEQGLTLISENDFDCIILDLNLQDMTGQDWLVRVEGKNIALPPVIIYTAKELSDDEYRDLRHYSSRIVIKSSASSARLHDEVALFLYQINDNRNELKEKENLHDLIEVFKGKRILVVDDDLRNTYALSKVLKEYGMEVVIADNGQLAIDKLAQKADFDLILMDVMMPIMDGYEAIKIIRDKYQDRHPIIALTAKAMPEDRKSCIDAGANDYLAKPVDINRLVSMVKIWLYH